MSTKIPQILTFQDFEPKEQDNQYCKFLEKAVQQHLG